MIESWGTELADGWDFDLVVTVVTSVDESIRAQPPECQNPFKSSWYWHEQNESEINRIRTALETAGIAAQVIYSSARDLDIVPTKANKGNAIQWLCNRLGIPPDQIAVAGDSGNDASMFLLEGVSGVIVANAEKALLEATESANPTLASRSCSEGVIEVLRPIVSKSANSNPHQNEPA